MACSFSLSVTVSVEICRSPDGKMWWSDTVIPFFRGVTSPLIADNMFEKGNLEEDLDIIRNNSCFLLLVAGGWNLLVECWRGLIVRGGNLLLEQSEAGSKKLVCDVVGRWRGENLMSGLETES